MIVIDLEMSGLDEIKCGIIEIGAVELENPKNIFSEIARIDEDEDLVDTFGATRTVSEVTGLREEEMRDDSKQSQKEMLEKFIEWSEKIEEKVFLCQNYMDISFLSKKAKKHDLKFPYYKFMDLHTLAQTIYYQQNKELLKENGKSKMGMGKIIEFCGLEDKRTVHTAIEDAKLTAECASRLLNGKKLLEEYENYEIPVKLKK